MGNDLEPVVSEKYPLIQQVKQKLLDLGCASAQMSGSGPSVFGTVKDRPEGERILSGLKREFARSYLLQAVDAGVETASEVSR